MAAMTGTALAAAGTAAQVAGALGKKKGDPGGSASGFAALPPEVQKVMLETYLPAAQKQFNKPYTAMPMQRVGAPQSIYDSPELYKLQQYSDAMGGMFTPLNQTPNMRADARNRPQTESKSKVTSVDEQVRKMYGMGLADYLTSQRPDVMSALGGSNPKFSQWYGGGGPDSEAATNWWNAWGSRGM
jgi:hypothetical protein